MSEEDRLISAARKPEDVDAALRPKSLDDFVGQKAARDNLRVFIEAARSRGDALDHVLFFGAFRDNPVADPHGGRVELCLAARDSRLGIEHDHHGLAVGGLMQRVVDDFYAAEIEPGVIAREFVVIARHIDDAAALARTAQEFLHHVVVRLGPVPAAPQLPAVDDVADQVQVFAVVVPQEFEQGLRLAARRSQMDVGNEDGAVPGARRIGCAGSQVACTPREVRDGFE